jgi:hypothetical protein
MNNNNKNDNNKVTPIGITNWRNTNQKFGIKDEDRKAHMYVIGKTGVGKTTLLCNMAISDIEKGKGIALIDPHGDVAETILNYIPKERINDVVYFNPCASDYPIGFNPLKGVHPSHHHLVASGIVSVFKKIWIESWGARLEHILRFSILTLLEYPDATLLDIPPLLTDSTFRSHVLDYVKEPHVRAFWFNEFDKFSPSLRSEAISPILNKMGLFLMSTPLRNIVGQKTNSFRMQQIMDEGKILIANLSKGYIGEDACALLGGMLVTFIQLSALNRARIEEHKRRPFYCYIDEFHSFTSLSTVDVLSEARKYGLSLFLSHQYIGQLHEKIRSAIIGNVGTIISFRIGADDALFLAKEFNPEFEAQDFVNLPQYSIYLKLMIDGTTSRPFSADTLPLPKYTESFKTEVIEASRKKYGKFKRDVEKDVFSRYSIESTDQKNLFD